MRHFVRNAPVLLFLLAHVAMAGPSQSFSGNFTPQYSRYRVNGRSGGDGGVASATLTYSDTTSTQTYLPQYIAGAPISDDLVTIDPTNPITAFTFSYFISPELRFGSTDATISFYDNDGITYPGGGATFLGSVDVNSLAGAGEHVVYVDGFSPIALTDNTIWMEVYFTNDQTGLVITDNPGGNVGFSNDLYAVNGTGIQTLGTQWSDFYLEVYQDAVPEPATATMLGLGLVATVRRLRKR